VTWAVTAGTLPAGVTLSSTGVLSGTPIVTGAFPITVTATDAGSCPASKNLTLTVACFSFAPTAIALPAGSRGVAYATTFTLTGGVAPVVFNVTSGVLPAGLAIIGNQIKGTPMAYGTLAPSPSPSPPRTAPRAPRAMRTRSRSRA
jgi:hypothetical protein